MTKVKKEGDKCTPLGRFFFRECWYRSDRMTAPNTGLPLRIITPTDGWCDDVGSPCYNRHVTLPFNFSHETLWREDHLYDVVVPLGYNDDPVIVGKGSAIFMHIAKPAYAGTEGCVALASADLLEILPLITLRSQIEIRAE